MTSTISFAVEPGEGNIIIFDMDGDNSLTGGPGDDILVGGKEDDTLEGGEGNDILVGIDGNDYISGGKGDDTLTGGGINFVNDTLFVTLDTSGIDTLSGGQGADLFVLGGNSQTQSEIVIHYDEAGNDDYALITDFNLDEDKIFLGGSKNDYRLGSSPNDLPVGTALYREDELIAIIQGSSELSLNESYFQGSDV
ncbi:hypothetical protein IQ238_16125 [Pleurocapsales cyanobacterium LEGE 06147]|nr:hypothetical protein [Pleurocapsales cyanobacterium LEGE 06147]